MASVIAFLLLMLVSIPVALLRGVVMVDLVHWYTPFHIGVVQAVGISILVSLFLVGVKRETYNRKEGDNLANAVGALVSSVMFTLLAWLFGYCWSFFL